MVEDRQTTTLVEEVKKFSNELPYWAKFLAEKTLSGNVISDSDIDTSYSYLLEELTLKEKTEKPEISITYNVANAVNYKPDLRLTKLENVEGVNALAENQTIEFSPNLTIIYGANGSGKSGYVRLFKNVFYSKAPETILQNIHVVNGHKPVNAKFTFESDNTEISFDYTNKNNAEFRQFSVFDGKGLFRQLAEKNEFVFRPSGLSFFADYTNAINRVEKKLNDEITTKKTGNTTSDLADLFDGNSEIRAIVQSLNSKTKIKDLKKYVPFSDEDKIKKRKIQKQYDELLLTLKGKEKEVKNLENIKDLLTQNKQNIEILNHFFTNDTITKIYDLITDCNKKEIVAKTEGIESFKIDKIDGIGTEEWKNFIVAAEIFAKRQKTENVFYPENGDNCLFCQQHLSSEAKKLIENYWVFIKSVAEQDVKQAQKMLNIERQKYEKLDFDLFPKDNILTVWLAEKYQGILDTLKQTLSEQQILAENIISDIQRKTVNERTEIITSVEQHEAIEIAIDTSIKMFNEDEQSKELEKLLEGKTFLEHKEKFNTHFIKFEKYINNQIWIEKANIVNFAKRKITDTEKNLSNKYFNQKYIDTFNEECHKLSGNFGIEIDHTGSAGKSYRQLKLKGNNPNVVLSEGEQKVIAIADFFAEMYLSEINRGIIFDDPVTSLDEMRKSEIAERFVKEASQKQVIIFTHDLVFVSSLIGHSKEKRIAYDCHWIENAGRNQPGTIYLKNTPSFEKDYKTSGKAQEYYNEAKKVSPEQREGKIKNGFAALRTSYEAQVIFGLFKGVVQRFNERVSVDSLKNVFFTTEIRDELFDGFCQCCRYMEGHLHSDKYAYKKPELENLNEEIQRFIAIKNKISGLKQPNP